MSEKISLDDLLVDEEELSEEMLVETLASYVRIGKSEGNLYPREPFRDLNSRRKVAVVLLSQHAREQLHLAETQWLNPTAIAELGGINVNTVYPSVRELAERGLVESDDGSYRIPPANVGRVRRFIEGADD